MNKLTCTKDKILLHEWILKISIAILAAAVFVCCGGLRFFECTNYVDAYINNPFQIHVIDVENGDAFLIKLPNNQTMMIDCGDERYQDRVISYINQYMKYEQLNKIDYLVLTHADNDHVGNAGKIIQTFNVVNVFRPKVYSASESNYAVLDKDYKIDDSQVYNKAIVSAYTNNCNIIFNEVNQKLIFENGFMQMLSPIQDSYNNGNNYSAVIMFEYRDYKMLFMGDADNSIEKNLVSIY